MEKKNIKEITIRIEGEEWEKALDKAFQKENEKVTLDGFRQGKAPKEVFLKKYGIGSLLMPAAEAKFEDAYTKMITDNKDLPVVARPKGDIVKLEESGVEYLFTLTLKPEVKVKKYKGFNVEKPEVKVTKEEVKKELDNLKKQYSELVVKETEAEMGDVVVFDFEGFLDDKPFEGGKAENHTLELGSNTFIPGFEEELVGLKTGDEKSFEIKFPEDYPSDMLKGKTTTFKVKINEVKSKKEPELNEEFFKDLAMDGIDSEESLLNQLEENIKVKKENELENEYMTKIFDAAILEMEVEVPEGMITDETDRMIDTYAQQLQMQGIKLEDYYKMTNTKEEDIKKMMLPEAEKRVKTRLLLEEIVNLEKLESTDKEAQDLLEELSTKYNTDKAEIEKMYGGLEPLKYEIKMRKAIDILKS